MNMITGARSSTNLNNSMQRFDMLYQAFKERFGGD